MWPGAPFDDLCIVNPGAGDANGPADLAIRTLADPERSSAETGRNSTLADRKPEWAERLSFAVLDQNSPFALSGH
jgi:hypothetical protein